MNHYEAKKQARADRLRTRAERKLREAAAADRGARAIADGIPMGQPILVGHHSERRHRRDLARIDRGFRRAYEGQQQAAELERRASVAESNTAISSDDPDATSKLRAKLAQLEAERDRYKAINRACRAKAAREKLAALGLSEAAITSLLEPPATGGGIPGYVLTNLGANIRRIRTRIEELERAAAAPERPDEQIGEITIEESDNRVRLIFPGKPSAETRRLLKSRGFRWSPTSGAWQRHASEGARHAAGEIARSLEATEPGAESMDQVYLVAPRESAAEVAPEPVDPRELARAYDAAHDECSAAERAGVLPADIRQTWPNVLGFLQRVPGQPYYRPGPNGAVDPPTAAEQWAALVALRIHADRARRAVAALGGSFNDGVER